MHVQNVAKEILQILYSFTFHLTLSEIWLNIIVGAYIRPNRQQWCVSLAENVATIGDFKQSFHLGN